MGKVLILDTETTGISDPVIPIEVAYIEIGKFENLKIKKSFRQLYNPGDNKIDYSAMVTHNIIPEDLVKKPIYTEFKLPENVEYMIGHNIKFDYKVIGSPENIKLIDTLQISRKLFPDLDSHKQGAILYYLLDHKKARKILKNSHSALHDVKICRIILEHFIRITNVKSFDELYEYNNIAKIPDKMPFGKHKGVSLLDLPKDYIMWLLNKYETQYNTKLDEDLRTELMKL